MKKVIVFAANGFIGNELLDFFLNKANFQVIAIARKEIKKNSENFKSVIWDGVNLGTWKTELENADLLLNLTGRSVNCRYTEDNKTEIYQSRIF
ncbi:MAG: epimerase, partial [Fluviicola sp.]